MAGPSPSPQPPARPPPPSPPPPPPSPVPPHATNTPGNPSCPHATDPPLLSQHSSFRSFATPRFSYPSLRVFHRPHPQIDQLPATPAPLPLLVFVHGLGGSIAQFHPLLTTLVHAASCLAVDLPGCGRSAFEPRDWAAYTPDALVGLLELIVEEYRDHDAGQGVVLIGHSMGTALCARLASPAHPHATDLPEHVVGLVAICPVTAGDGERDWMKVAFLRTLFWIPAWVFDIWRMWDRRGGVDSPSVRRFVGPGAPLELRALQSRFNDQSRTLVWRRMAYACLPVYDARGVPGGGLAGRKEWQALDIPVFLVGGESDGLTSPKEVDKIAGYLDPEYRLADSPPPPVSAAVPDGKLVPDSAAPVNLSPNPAEHLPRPPPEHENGSPGETTLAPSAVPSSSSSLLCSDSPGSPDSPDSRNSPVSPPPDSPRTPDTPGSPNFRASEPVTPTETPPPAPVSRQPAHPPKLTKTLVLPAPANHTLLYHPATARTLAGLVSDFLSAHVSPRFDLGWQLQHLSREGKWDVKNLAKWKRVAPVSAPVGPPDRPPIFRAMKTLREADEEHGPAAFAARWAAELSDVVDISHDRPVYDPRGLERAGVHYHKFPTVSKVPPSPAEVDTFVALVDRIRAERQESEPAGDRLVGVHCHYGFNRTGYFIVCYLVERCGMTLQQAIDTFAAARPNGIKHPHFLDRLFVRYGLGVRK